MRCRGPLLLSLCLLLPMRMAGQEKKQPLKDQPRSLFAMPLGVPAGTFAKFPKREVYIGKGKVPPPLPAHPARGSLRTSPLSHKYPLAAQEPHKFPGGEIRLASAREFPLSKTMTGATMLAGNWLATMMRMALESTCTS